MDGEIVRQKTRAAEFERNTRQLEVNLEAAKKETLTLQHSVAWRTIDEKQASIIEKTLSGKNVEGHFIVMNRDDPEQAQFFQRISGFCIKIKVVCRLHLV